MMSRIVRILRRFKRATSETVSLSVFVTAAAATAAGGTLAAMLSLLSWPVFFFVGFHIFTVFGGTFLRRWRNLLWVALWMSAGSILVWAPITVLFGFKGGLIALAIPFVLMILGGAARDVSDFVRWLCRGRPTNPSNPDSQLVDGPVKNLSTWIKTKIDEHKLDASVKHARQIC